MALGLAPSWVQWSGAWALVTSRHGTALSSSQAVVVVTAGPIAIDGYSPFQLGDFLGQAEVAVTSGWWGDWRHGKESWRVNATVFGVVSRQRHRARLTYGSVTLRPGRVLFGPRFTGTGPKTGPAAMDEPPVSRLDSHGFLPVGGVGGDSAELRWYYLLRPLASKLPCKKTSQVMLAAIHLWQAIPTGRLKRKSVW